MTGPRALCERTRAWAALAPDGELSELERRLLGAHLARCGDCSRFAGAVEWVVAELRTTSPQAPSRRLRVPAAQRGVLARRLHAVGAVAAVAVMALGVAARAPLPSGQDRPARPPQRTISSSIDEDEIKVLHRLRREALAAPTTDPDRPAKDTANRPA